MHLEFADFLRKILQNSKEIRGTFRIPEPVKAVLREEWSSSFRIEADNMRLLQIVLTIIISKQRAAKLCGGPLLLITSHGDTPPCKPNPSERCSHFLPREAEEAPGGGEAGEVTVGDHHSEAQGQHTHQDNLQAPQVRTHGGQARLTQGLSNQKQQSLRRRDKPTANSSKSQRPVLNFYNSRARN